MNNNDFNAILKRDFNEEFIVKMKKAMLTSHYKYGYVSQTYPDLAQAQKCIVPRLNKYLETHNSEYLVDIANFAMIEFMFPSFDDVKYIPTDSKESIGLADGISYNELMAQMEE